MQVFCPLRDCPATASGATSGLVRRHPSRSRPRCHAACRPVPPSQHDSGAHHTLHSRSPSLAPEPDTNPCARSSNTTVRKHWRVADQSLHNDVLSNRLATHQREKVPMARPIVRARDRVNADAVSGGEDSCLSSFHCAKWANFTRILNMAHFFL